QLEADLGLIYPVPIYPSAHLPSAHLPSAHHAWGRSCVLAGAPTRARRAGEGLGDVKPPIGDLAGHAQRRGVAMAATRDHEAEVERRAGDAVGRLRRSPGPQFTARTG